MDTVPIKNGKTSHGVPSLTEADMVAIRQDRKRGLSIGALTAKYHRHTFTIHKVIGHKLIKRSSSKKKIGDSRSNIDDVKVDRASGMSFYKLRQKYHIGYDKLNKLFGIPAKSAQTDSSKVQRANRALTASSTDNRMWVVIVHHKTKKITNSYSDKSKALSAVTNAHTQGKKVELWVLSRVPFTVTAVIEENL